MKMLRPLALLITLAGARSAIALDESGWALGFWQQTSDEDHGSLDYFEVRKHGTFIDHGYYQTFEIEDKGPVALIFRPNAARNVVTYTSPPTRNNAVSEQGTNDP